MKVKDTLGACVDKFPGYYCVRSTEGGCGRGK